MSHKTEIESQRRFKML